MALFTPCASSALGGLAITQFRAMTGNGPFVFGITHANALIITNASPFISIPNNSAVAFDIGTIITIFSNATFGFGVFMAGDAGVTLNGVAAVPITTAAAFEKQALNVWEGTVVPITPF